MQGLPSLAVAAALLMMELAAGQVPSYIEVCGRHEPKLSECVERSVRKLRGKLRAGIPELEVPGIEPLRIERIALSEREELRATASELAIAGLSDFAIQRLQLDLEGRRIDIQLRFERLSIKANYEVRAKIIVPIAERGPLDIVTGEVAAKVTLRFGLVERGSRRHMHFSSMSASLDISDYTVKPGPSARDKPLARVIGSVLTSSRREVIGKLTPDLEKAISAKVLQMANQICKHFSFDELFPDRP